MVLVALSFDSIVQDDGMRGDTEKEDEEEEEEQKDDIVGRRGELGVDGHGRSGVYIALEEEVRATR